MDRTVSARPAGGAAWRLAALYGVVAALIAVPLALTPVPPLYDYPNHLARMHVLADFAHSAALRANYAVAWKPSPYIGMDLVVPPMARLLGVYDAGRLFLFICLVQAVAGVAAIHAALYRRLSPWPAASALFGYSLVMSLGFVNYLFGLGTWMLAFAGWIWLSGRGPAARLAGGLALALIVFFNHYFAVAGYGLCVAAYEFGGWRLEARPRLVGLAGRWLTAGAPFLIPLYLCTLIGSGPTGGGVIHYGGLWSRLSALASPVSFPSAPLAMPVLVLLLIPEARRGRFGRLSVAPAMWPVLLLLGAAALAIPAQLAGVAELDCRLPLAIVWLAIAGSEWRGGTEASGRLARRFLVGLLAFNMIAISLMWAPLARQFGEFRAALAVIPRGARVIAFRDDDFSTPRPRLVPPIAYAHLPALAIIERDAFVPFLFKNAMMPVQAAAALRDIDTPTGETLGLADMRAGLAPGAAARRGAMLTDLDVRNYWAGWPDRFDYAVELSFGAHPRLPGQLVLVRAGSFFNIYRIARAP